MAITYSSSVITVSGGKETGTATSGAATTLTDSSKSWTTDAYKNRILWIHTGTGAGAVARITGNTATVLTCADGFYTYSYSTITRTAVTPDNTSQYMIMFNLEDIRDADIAGSWGVFLKQNTKQYYSTARIQLSSGTRSGLGDIWCDLRFSSGSPYISLQASNLNRIVFGYEQDDGIARGSSRIVSYKTNTFTSDLWYSETYSFVRVNSGGEIMFFDTELFTPDGYPPINPLSGSKILFRDCEINSTGQIRIVTTDVYIDGLKCLGTEVPQATIDAGGGHMFTLLAAVPTFKNFEVRNYTYAMTGAGGANPDQNFTLDSPILYNNVTSDVRLYGNHYFKLIDPQWSANITAESRPADTDDDGDCDEYYRYNLNIKNSSDANLSGVAVYCNDVFGTNLFNVTTDSNGNIAEQQIRYKRYSNNAGTLGVTTYSPLSFKIRNYGYQFQAYASTIAQKTNEGKQLTTNAYTVASYATAWAYTGITTTGSSNTTALSSSRTMQALYDYSQAWAVQSGNMQYSEQLTTTNGTDFTLISGGLITGAQHLDLTGKRLAGGTIRYSATGTYTPRLGVITVDFSQDGTYNFAGADFGGQVTFTNSSGGNVTVELETGVDYINSGPNITISEPQVYESATISGLTAGTRIQLYDLTSNTQLYNGTPTFPYTWTDPSPYAADREIRLRHTLVSGTTAKEFVETIIGTVTETSPSISYLANQVDDAVYNANGINGSTVTGITFTDAATDLVNINISAGSVTWQSIYAAFVYWMFTATGIADDIAYVDAVDPANYRLTSMKIKNTSSPMVPLEITGGYGVDNTTGASIDLVDTTGGTLVFAPDHVVNNIVTVGGTNIITGDIDDVTAKVQAGLTAQGYTTTRAPKLDNLDATIATRASETNATANKNAVLVAVGNVAGGASVAEIEASTVLAKKTDITALNDISVSDVVSGMQAVANDFKADISGLATEANAASNANAIISAIPEPQTPPTAVQIADEIVTRDIAKESTASSNKADVIAKIDTIPTPDVPTSEEIADEVMTRDILTETNFKSLR